VNIKIDMEITPEEVRRLMGLPDVQAFQDELMSKIREQMEAGVEGYDPQTLMQPFMNNAFASMEFFQKMMAGAVGMAGRGGKSD
jgi:hypothetical protein